MRVAGGLIDRTKPLHFTFDGRRYDAFAGDTLASALLANDVRLVARSFKYHRPRGVLSAGSEEPNALVTLHDGAQTDPNARATMVELFDGLRATSQNRVGSLRFDLMAVNDWLSPLFAAGFYYKTFMWPAAFWERLYEPLIRRAAGLGALPRLPDPDGYDKGFLHCDLLVIGGGAAGLMAALTAARAGARVVLADEGARLGGRLLSETHTLDGATGADWVAGVLAELASLPNLRILPRTTIWGTFDHGVYGALERVGEHLPDAALRQTLWRITARAAVLASGATERHIPFANNDRPGVMLAGAVRTYLNRYAVSPASRVAVFTNNDDGHRTALDLMAQGVSATVIDTRDNARALGDYPLHAGAVVTDTRGRLGLSRVQVQRGSSGFWIDAGALAVAGGWNPNLHLAAHHRAKPVWDGASQTFLPAPGAIAGLHPAGAAAGQGTTAAALRSGAATAQAALQKLGITAHLPDLPDTDDTPCTPAPFWHVAGKGRAFVDFQNDVTVKDIALAHQENMRPVEHLKRWTTLGMATDQGKTANVPAIAIMAELTGRGMAETGTTMYRPPYTPVALAALGGGDTGPQFRPTRLTPTHAFATALGAPMVEVGQWLRAQYFPRAGETHWRHSVDREVLATRAHAGVCDVSTLGKIDVQGRDAGTFLNRLYANRMDNLPVGRVRYGLMLREDGFAFDDGTVARMGDIHFIVTTTTAQAGAVYRHMEFARQCLWPGLDVQIISTTDTVAQLSIAGPQARAILSQVVDGFDLSNDAFPFMACADLTVCGGIKARVFRISFSGELAYELAVPARFGAALMERLVSLGATPYGTETLGVLRIEKGHPAGNELNGQTSAHMLGLGRMVSTAKDSIGAVLSRRDGLAQDPRVLVGLAPLDAGDPVVAGAHLFADGAAQGLDTDLGWISSACFSPHLGHAIGLGFLAQGGARMGQVIVAANPVQGQSARLRVVPPCFIDPDGGRMRA